MNKELEQRAIEHLKAFDLMLQARDKRGLINRFGWETGKDVFKWWMGEDPLQLTFEDIMDGEI